MSPLYPPSIVRPAAPTTCRARQTIPPAARRRKGRREKSFWQIRDRKKKARRRRPFSSLAAHDIWAFVGKGEGKTRGLLAAAGVGEEASVVSSFESCAAGVHACVCRPWPELIMRKREALQEKQEGWRWEEEKSFVSVYGG